VASNKNQHFVPRCHLKPFTLDGAGTSINVYNLDRRKGFQNAAVKSQCSSDYFYGIDPGFEPYLQQIEGLYAEVVRSIGSPDYALTEMDRAVLRWFCYLQSCRTEAAAKRYVEISSDMAEFISSRGEPDVSMSLKEAAASGVMQFLSTAEEVGDLKVCLIQNQTPLEFITSDDPAALTNRWYIQRPEARGMGYGAGNAGTLFLLPVTPRVCCIVYDGDVYSIQNIEGWRQVNRIEDVVSINEHQFLNCNANVYFRSWEGLKSVRAAHADVDGRRLASRYRLNYAVLDSQNEWGSRYRVVSKEEATTHNCIVHWESVRPTPRRWPSVIQWRSDRKVYSNGTGQNFVRKAATEVYRPGSPPFRNVG
jgi:hypothetical protein